MQAKAILGVGLVLATAWSCGGPPTDPGPWPQWRGVGGNGVSSETHLPVSWTEENGIRWATELPGAGLSSPIVGPDAIYLTAALSKGEGNQKGRPTQFLLLALSRKTGELLWQSEVVQRPVERLHRFNRSAAATPVTDGETVFAHFGSHLGAVSTDGEVLWSREIDTEYLDESRYGTGSSLVLTDDAIIVFRDREYVESPFGWLAAFSKATGEELWRREWTDSCCSYATPLPLNFAGEDELLVAHATKMVSYAPKTGKTLWQREVHMFQPVASPVVEGDLLCVGSGAHAVREMGCWRLRFENGKRGIRNLWKQSSGVPGMPSPVLYNGLLFAVNEKGIARCYKAKSGRELWRKRLTTGDYTASLVAGEGKVYALSADGAVSVFSAAPKFELLGESQMPEGETMASPAIADGCLLIRTQGHLYCVEGAPSP